MNTKSTTTAQILLEQTLTVSRTHKIIVDFPLHQAARLFTAQGEVLWTPNWLPILIKGDGFHTGDTFLNASDNNTIFVVTDYNEQNGHIGYVRVAEGVSVATIDINIDSKGESSSVEITYTMTALNKEANDSVAKLTDDAFKQEMLNWEMWIHSADTEIKAWLETM
ncbi:hypothetical protein [Enterovibrio calviensis]|uniref:hypothetical protein n=1 Tax=Enterovibrio calviensis TaxID=91359 RepID=UPI0004845E6B|nr:hypothetical protein [Enterovibrio calviensis]